MKYLVYRNMQTDEIVNEEDWEDYALEKLGITVQSKGRNGELTTEQVEIIETITEWYFSDNWIKEEEDDEDRFDLEEELEIADRIYQDNLDKEWGIA